MPTSTPLGEFPLNTCIKSPVGRRAGRPRSVSESGHSQSSGSDVSARLALLATPGRTASNNLHDAQTGSGDEDDVGEARKPRPPPLPDIMHDWEIIVKSLKANERREKQEVSKESSTSGKPSLRGKGLDFSGEQRVLPAEASKPSNSTFEADSDKENSRLTEKPAASCPDSTEDNNDNQIQPPVPAASPGEMSDSSSEQNSQTTDLLGNLNSDVEKQKVGNINIVNKKSTKSSADRRTEGESDECDEEKSKSGERTPRKGEDRLKRGGKQNTPKISMGRGNTVDSVSPSDSEGRSQGSYPVRRLSKSFHQEEVSASPVGKRKTSVDGSKEDICVKNTEESTKSITNDSRRTSSDSVVSNMTEDDRSDKKGAVENNTTFKPVNW
nr:uncharacterized protein LOC113827585 [Penaeus vannamei]